MAKAEISWKRQNEDGDNVQVYAHRTGGKWIFYSRRQRFDQWQEQSHASLEDWLELLDAVRRRVPRKKYPPDEVQRVEQAIRERFPEVKF